MTMLCSTLTPLESHNSRDAADELDLCQKYYPREMETGVCLNFN